MSAELAQQARPVASEASFELRQVPWVAQAKAPHWEERPVQPVPW
jgi:hypothetical protein